MDGWGGEGGGGGGGNDKGGKSVGLSDKEKKKGMGWGR